MMAKRICIVTNELQDIPISGGAGTANQHLGCCLAQNGFEVHVLYVGKATPAQIDFFQNRHSICLHNLPDFDIQLSLKQEQLRSSIAVYQWLAATKIAFEVVLFNDYMHLGYFCLALKGSIRSCAQAQLGIICHGPIAWCDDTNGIPLSQTWQLSMHNTERACLQMADFLLAPSRYLVDWMEERGWLLPEDKAIIPYVLLPESGTWATLPSRQPIERIEEIVFFGRLETRKGVDTFIDALALLPPEALANRTITFLGWDGPTPQRILQEKMSALNLAAAKMQFITNYNATQARAYLRDHAALAVMPSSGDNSPCVIYECMADGIPFVASTMGGQPELTHPDDHSFCLAPPYPEAFAEILEKRLLSEDARTTRPSPALHTALECTVAFFDRQAEKSKSNSGQIVPPTCPLVSIVIPTFNRAELVGNAVRSALEQDYPNIEVVIVNDGSTDQSVKPALEALQAVNKRIRIVHQENRYLGAARNTGVRHAMGELIVFLDDDNTLFTHFVSTCYSYLSATAADAVVPAMRRRTSSGKPIGFYHSLGALGVKMWGSISLLHNVYGDACGMIKRDICLEYPVREMHGVGHEDWYFWAQLAKYGKKIIPLPMPLFDYCAASDSMINTTSRYKNFVMQADVCKLDNRCECINLAESIYF